MNAVSYDQLVAEADLAKTLYLAKDTRGYTAWIEGFARREGFTGTPEECLLALIAKADAMRVARRLLKE